MNAGYIALVLAGLLLTCWGFPAAYRLGRPWHILAAIAALAGVVTSLIGTLLLAVPGFFSR